MEQRDYSRELPTTPPEGLMEWAQGRGLFDGTDLLTYRADYYTEPLTGEKTKAVLLRCSACGGEQYAEHVPNECCNPQYAPAPFGYIDPINGEKTWANESTLCPMCGAQVTAKHIGQLRYPERKQKYVVTVGRLEDKLVLSGWAIEKHIDKDARVRWTPWPYEAYVFEHKKAVKLMGYVKCITTLKMTGEWAQRVKCTDTWRYCEHVMPWDAGLLVGSTCENSKLDIFARCANDPLLISYLRLWQKHRTAENFVMQGAGALLNDMMSTAMGTYNSYYPASARNATPSGIDWKKKRPSAMLGLSRDELRCCVAQQWKGIDLSVYKTMREGGQPPKLPEDMALIINSGSTKALELLNAGEPCVKVLRYLDKQNRKGAAAGANSTVDVRYWKDYMRFARSAGENVADDSIRFPPNLRRAHDRVMAENERRERLKREKALAAEMAKREAGFDRQREELALYCWESGGLFIRPCSDETELRAEGAALHHCVSGYADRHASGATAIFFLRRCAAPEEPWYTVQLNTKALTVDQNRGNRNCDRTDEVKSFEAAWLKHIRALPKKRIKKEDTAA